jgi:outer membrane protein OmpA-like peptidoglycan-associated protein
MRIASMILAAAVAIALQPAPSGAQSSEEDLLKRFETHRSTHRGLSLAPVTSTGATAAGAATAATAATQGSSGGSQGAATVSGTAASAQPARQAATATTTAPDVEYVRMPEDAQINIRIEFDFDSAVLRPSEFGKLETLCNAIRRSDVGVFHIFGHTDSSGSAAYNLNLSLRRAEEVRRHMIDECGIEASRLRAIGLGQQYPLIPQDARAPENRRVEFQAIG